MDGAGRAIRGGRTWRRKEWLRLQWELDEQRRKEREEALAARESEEAEAALRAAAEAAEQIHGVEIEPAPANAERLLALLKKPRVEPRREERKEAKPRAEPKPLSLDAALAMSRRRTLDAALGFEAIERSGPSPQKLAKVVKALVAFLEAEKGEAK